MVMKLQKTRYHAKRSTGKPVKVKIYKSTTKGTMHRRLSSGKALKKTVKLYKTKSQAMKALKNKKTSRRK